MRRPEPFLSGGPTAYPIAARCGSSAVDAAASEAGAEVIEHRHRGGTAAW
jgi:hypothetical protein